jgi:hypothetical protein
MNQVQVVKEVIEPNYLTIKESIQAENRDLSEMLDRITSLKQSYDSFQLAKDIRALQDATRIQNMNGEVRGLMLTELQRRKLIKQVIDGERI